MAHAADRAACLSEEALEALLGAYEQAYKDQAELLKDTCGMIGIGQFGEAAGVPGPMPDAYVPSRERRERLLRLENAKRELEAKYLAPSDLSFCKVYITTLDGGETTKTAAEHLKKAEGFFKRRINERVKMRKLPQLIFVADNSMDYYEHISEVISKLPKPADENDGGDSEREDE